MKYLDKLEISCAGGLSLIAAGMIKNDYAVFGTGLGLVASGIGGLTIANDYQDFEQFEELRNEFEKRERWYQEMPQRTI